MAQLAVDDEAGRELDEAEGVLGLLLPADEPTPEAVKPRVGDFNGLVTNDKFCLTRYVRLRLRWRSQGGAPPRGTQGTHG